MKNESSTKNEEEKYLQTKENIIHNLYDQKETEKKYLETVDNLLNYWVSELKPVDSQSTERHNQLLKLIKAERGTIKKIGEDINRINEMIDKTEKNLEKIREMINSFRKE